MLPLYLLYISFRHAVSLIRQDTQLKAILTWTFLLCHITQSFRADCEMNQRIRQNNHAWFQKKQLPTSGVSSLNTSMCCNDLFVLLIFTPDARVCVRLVLLRLIHLEKNTINKNRLFGRPELFPASFSLASHINFTLVMPFLLLRWLVGQRNAFHSLLLRVYESRSSKSQAKTCFDLIDPIKLRQPVYL